MYPESPPDPKECSFCKADLSDGLWCWAKNGPLCKKCLKLAMKKVMEIRFQEIRAKWETQGWPVPKRSTKSKK